MSADDPRVADLRIDKSAALVTFDALEWMVTSAVREDDYELAACYANAMFLQARQLPGWWEEFRNISDQILAEGSREDHHHEQHVRAAFQRLKRWADANGHPIAEWFDGGTPGDGDIAPWEELTESQKQQVAKAVEEMGVELENVEQARHFYANRDALDAELGGGDS